MLKLFGASVPLAAEPIFHVGPLAITNAMFFGVIVAAAVVLLLWPAARRTTLRPVSKFAFAVEACIDMLWNAIAENFNGSRERARKHVPLAITLFAFILLSNLSGMLPGVGSIVAQSGDTVTPLLRPFTTDLNGTLALAVLTIGLVQIYAIKELGVRGRLKHFFTNKPWNPMNLFIGLVEIMSEFIRIVTLSMRLFGVIYAGKVLLHVIDDLSGSFGWATTIPVYFLEIFFSAIQAYIFVMLATAYLGMATAGHDEEHSQDHPPSPVLKTAVANDKVK